MIKFLLDMRKDFLIMSNFYLVEILSEPNSLTIVASNKILKMSNYVLILSFFSHNENQEFAVIRITNERIQDISSASYPMFLFKDILRDVL